MNTWTDDKEQELFEAQETIAELLEALQLCYTRIFNYQAGMDELRDPKTTTRLNNDALVPATEAIRKASR